MAWLGDNRSVSPLLNYQQLLLILGLLIILALVIFLWYIPAHRNGSNQHLVAEHSLPDYFGKDVLSQKYDISGTVVNKLQAQSMKHYPSDDVTWLTYPKLWSYDKNHKVAWYAVSDRGKMLSDHKTFQMIDHVVVIQPATASRSEIRLKTKKMTVYTGRHIVETNQPVNITEPGRQVNSVGLRYDYKSNIVELKSRVRGTGKVN